MIKRTLSFAFIFCVLFAFSQSTHFMYIVHFKEDSLSDTTKRELMVLDVDKTNAKFYPYEYLKNDSLFIKTGEYVFSYPKLNIKLKRKIGSNETQNFINQSPLYYVYTTKRPIKWAISNETKKIEQYNVQKATANFGGRLWEAWFTPDIPISEGPYKFNGLPGLIISIKDDKNHYQFQLTSVKNFPESYNTTSFIEQQNNKKPLKIAEKQWAKIQLDYYENPMKDYPENALYVKNKNGEVVKADNRNITLQMQSFLRKKNNPIELDKAVKYPEK